MTSETPSPRRLGVLRLGSLQARRRTPTRSRVRGRPSSCRPPDLTRQRTPSRFCGSCQPLRRSASRERAGSDGRVVHTTIHYTTGTPGDRLLVHVGATPPDATSAAPLSACILRNSLRSVMEAVTVPYARIGSVPAGDEDPPHPRTPCASRDRGLPVPTATQACARRRRRSTAATASWATTPCTSWPAAGRALGQCITTAGRSRATTPHPGCPPHRRHPGVGERPAMASPESEPGPPSPY